MRFDLGQIDLNLLHTFRTVSELGSVGLAARRLGRSQPAISVRLRQLERDLGVSLFERSGRRLSLTPVGRALDAEARQVVHVLQGVLDAVRAAASEPVGTLRLGALPTLSTYLLAPVIAGYLAEHAGARVHVSHGLTRQQLDALKEGSLDLVVSIGPPPVENVEVTVFGEVRPVLTLPALTRMPRGRVPLRRLRAMPYIHYGRTGDGFFDGVWEWIAAQGLDRDVRLQVPHIQAIKALIRAGAGASILPDYTVVEPDLVTRGVEGLDLRHPLWFATRPRGRGVPLIGAFARRLAPGRAISSSS